MRCWATEKRHTRPTGWERPSRPLPGAGLHTSIFADLFAALGFAGVAGETKDAAWATLADDMLEAARARIAAGPVPTEPYPIRPGFRAFSLPMILVGTGAQVHRATGSARSAATVRAAAERMRDVFLHGDDMSELVPVDPADTDTLLARHRTPGHVLEACWFLAEAGEVLRPGSGGAADLPLSSPADLADIAIRSFTLGWDDKTGGLLRYADRDGGMPRGRRSDDRYEALVVQTWDTKLWWPHSEALYALLLLGLRTGREDLMEAHDRTARLCDAHLPGRPRARVDPDPRPRRASAGGDGGTAREGSLPHCAGAADARGTARGGP